MSIIKSNSAQGAFKGVAEWITNHTNIFIDLNHAEKAIVLTEDGYDMSSKLITSNPWDAKKLYFHLGSTDSQSLYIPSVLSSTFLERIEHLYIIYDEPDPEYGIIRDYDGSGFKFTSKNIHLWSPERDLKQKIEISQPCLLEYDIKSLMNFPHMSNLKKLQCPIPKGREFNEFIHDACECAEHISPGYTNVVYIDVLDNRDIVIDQWDDVIRNRLAHVSIDKASSIKIHANYIYFNKVVNTLNSSNQVKSLDIVGEVDLPDTITKKEGKCIYLINLDLTHFSCETLHVSANIQNCYIDNLSECISQGHMVDDRSKIKSGLGVDPITSTAIDMFGNCLHKGDLIALSRPSGCISFAIIDKIIGEDVGIKGIKDASIYSQSLSNSYALSDMCVSYDEFRSAYRNNSEDTCILVPDRTCWKIPIDYIIQSDRNGFIMNDLGWNKEDFISEKTSKE